MTRFRALMVGGVFALAFTIAGCFGEPNNPCYDTLGAGAAGTGGGGEVCYTD